MVSVVSSQLLDSCQNESFLLTASSATAVSYSWSNGAIDTITQAFVSGQYTVTVTDTNGCHSQGDIIVTINPQNTVSGFTILAQEAVHLHGNNVVLSGGVGATDLDGKVAIHNNSMVTAHRNICNS